MALRTIDRYLNKVFHGNALDLLRTLPDDCVDAVITDAMFGTAKYDWGPDPAHGDLHRHWDYHRPIYQECVRVLRPGGALAWGSAGNSCRFFEEWFGPHRVWNLARIGLKNLLAVGNVWIVQSKEQQPIEFPVTDPLVVCNRADYLPLRHYHPYPKPIEEMAFLVRHLTRPGEVVVGCFAGVGSTLIAAQSLGRQWIGCDLSRAYCRVALRRLGGLELNTTSGTPNKSAVTADLVSGSGDKVSHLPEHEPAPVEKDPTVNWVDKQCESIEWETPRYILDSVTNYFGGSIPLDPATGQHNPTQAQRFFTEAEDGLAQPFAEEMGGALMVRVAVGQGDQPQCSSLELPQNPSPGPAGRGIDQHVARQVDVEQIAGPAGQLPDVRGDQPHGDFPSMLSVPSLSNEPRRLSLL